MIQYVDGQIHLLLEGQIATKLTHLNMTEKLILVQWQTDKCSGLFLILACESVVFFMPVIVSVISAKFSVAYFGIFYGLQ